MSYSNSTTPTAGTTLSSLRKDQAAASLIASSRATIPTLKASVALSMMQRPTPPLPHLPPSAFGSRDIDDSNNDQASVASFGSSSTCASNVNDKNQQLPAGYAKLRSVNLQARRMTDLSNDGLFGLEDSESKGGLDDSAATYYHDESAAYADEANTLSKLMTLQSIDRLESHLPHIVVDQIIADMTQRKEEVKQEKENPLTTGTMTLEVPIDVNMAMSNSSKGRNITSERGTTAATADSSSVRSKQQRRESAGSGMSDLRNTLASLDELLEEEFSSSDEDGSSEDDDDEDGSSEDIDGSDESSSYEGSSDEYGSSSSEEAGDESSVVEDERMDASALTFAEDSDDGVSDMGDDVISDFGDSDHLDDDLDDDDLGHDQPSSSAPSRRQSEVVRPAPRRRGAPQRAKSFGSNGSVNSGFSSNSGGQRSRSGSILSGRSGGHNSVGGGGPAFGRSNTGEVEVGKLRQGRLNHRRLESDTVSDDRSMSVDLTTLSTKSEGGVVSMSTGVQSTQHQSAILFVDISGFTKLSRSLEVEALSEIINNYFQKIVHEIKACGGDILKFAGDALIVEWTQDMLPEGQKHLNVTLMAAMCGSQLVDKCSDYPVDRDGKHICTLNLHCALGFGEVVGAHCGDMDRMEYLILGDSIKQIADAMDLAKLGEVVASPQAMAMLAESVTWADVYVEGQHHTVAFKKDQKFETKASFEIPKTIRVPISEQCEAWSAQELEDLQRRMSRYVHGVVYADEFSREESMAVLSQKRASLVRNSNAKCKQTQSELRDVFTVFIQPKITDDLNGEAAGDDETLDLLNSIMFIVNTEVTHHKAHLRQFIVDDKGLVVIANFGLRGSTFPNMIEERAIPCITNVRTLLKTELDLECSIGATYGKAYCGVVGGKTRHEYAILGPSVNLAARLMANACNPGILVDEQVKLMSGERPFKALAPVKAKGYDDLVKIYNPDDNVRKIWKDVEDEFVGRQEEICSLIQTADSVIHDAFASKVVFVSGPYGIGKSHVLSHATQKIESICKEKDTPTHISRLVFNADDSFRPFSIVRPLFLALLRRKAHIPSFGAAETTGHTDITQKTELEEAQLYVGLLQICLEAKIPMQYIEMFGGLIFSTKLSDIGTWSDRSRKMSEWSSIAGYLVTAFIHCTAEYGLVLLSLDDVSGMDEMSWKILQRLFQRASNLMVIGTARNEFDLNVHADFWSELNEEGIDSGRFRHLRMTPMILDDVRQLACKRLGKSPAELDDAICKTVNRQSRGNPLMACEILDVMYTEHDASEPAASGAALNKIEELLLNRLDELSPLDRSHLNLGAILGFSFEESDIVAVMEKYNDVGENNKESHARNVRSSLQESVEYGVLKCTEGIGKTIYQFANALWMKTIATHILDSWKDEMRALIEVATDDENCNICVKYDWDELASIKANLSSMRQQNAGIQDSIKELRSMISRAR